MCDAISRISTQRLEDARTDLREVLKHVKINKLPSAGREAHARVPVTRGRLPFIPSTGAQRPLLLDYTSIQGQAKGKMKRASGSLPRAATDSLGVRITLICTSLS